MAQYPWLSQYPASIDWAAPLPVSAAHHLLQETVQRFGARPFLDFLGTKLTYDEVWDVVTRLATGLQGLGFGKGQRIGLMLPNCPYYVMAYFAILRTGATVVNFNPLYADAELVGQIKDSDISLMFTLDLASLHDKLQRVMPQTQLKRMVVCPFTDYLPPLQRVLFNTFRRKLKSAWHEDETHLAWRSLLCMGNEPKPIHIDPEKDIAVLQYTGGTTGTPKGAALTHANIVANAVQCGLWFVTSVPGQERMMAVLPLFHVFAMTAVMNLGIRIGAEIILLPRFDLNQLLKTIHSKRPTLFPAVPTIYNAIIHHPKLNKYNLRSIRECISGGGPLPVEVKHQFEKLTGCKLVEGYGLSESSPVATCNPLYGVNKTGSIGLPLPGTVLEIVSLENPDQLLPQGERGELTIRGPQVMQGYWNKPDETAQVLRNGRLHTGDVAIMDEEGYFFIVDRIKDMIIASGYKVYPRNVEEAIYQHSAVAECIVAGVPDAYRGQNVKAYIKLKDGMSLTAEALTAFLKDKLSPLEMPKLIEFRSSLPRTMIGKLDRKALLAEEAAKKTS